MRSRINQAVAAWNAGDVTGCCSVIRQLMTEPNWIGRLTNSVPPPPLGMMAMLHVSEKEGQFFVALVEPKS